MFSLYLNLSKNMIQKLNKIKLNILLQFSTGALHCMVNDLQC